MKAGKAKKTNLLGVLWERGYIGTNEIQNYTINGRQEGYEIFFNQARTFSRQHQQEQQKQQEHQRDTHQGDQSTTPVTLEKVLKCVDVQFYILFAMLPSSCVPITLLVFKDM